MDFKKLTNDLLKAKNVALNYKNADDGGTCNLDTFVLIAKRLNYEKLKEAVANAGLRCSKWIHGCYHIYGYECGQANRRTDMVEAFEKVMRDLDYQTTIYYAMD